MNKKRVIKIFILIIVILLVAILIHTVRNYSIIKGLQKSIEPYLSSNNYHIKSISTEEDDTKVIIDYYKKNGKEVLIFEKNTNGDINKTTTYINENRTDIFYETENEKEVELDTEAMLMINLSNGLETENDFQTFIGSIMAQIRKIEYNGKRCYAITNFLSIPFLNGTSNDEKYIEKETGLYVKGMINSTTVERIYEFDNVDDSIFIEPDISQYNIK